MCATTVDRTRREAKEGACGGGPDPVEPDSHYVMPSHQRWSSLPHRIDDGRGAMPVIFAARRFTARSAVAFLTVRDANRCAPTGRDAVITETTHRRCAHDSSVVGLAASTSPRSSPGSPRRLPARPRLSGAALEEGASAFASRRARPRDFPRRVVGERGTVAATPSRASRALRGGQSARRRAGAATTSALEMGLDITRRRRMAGHRARPLSRRSAARGAASVLIASDNPLLDAYLVRHPVISASRGLRADLIRGCWLPHVAAPPKYRSRRPISPTLVNRVVSPCVADGSAQSATWDATSPSAPATYRPCAAPPELSDRRRRHRHPAIIGTIDQARRLMPLGAIYIHQGAPRPFLSTPRHAHLHQRK